MADYIDREALLKEIDEAIDADGLGYVVGQTMKRYLKRQSATDVAPVVHGKWEITSGQIENAVCSSCGTHYQAYYSDYQYCPRCGAKMQDE